MISNRLWLLVVVVIAALAVACGGGGGGPTPVTPSQQTGGDGEPPADESQPFSVVLTATPDQGPTPLTVSFSAYAFGGYPSYSYEWDFDGDEVADSNAVDPYWTFNNSAIITVKITDSRHQTVTVSKSITVTAPTGESGGTGTQPLVVRFQPSVNSGPAPLRVQFTALVSGGSPPYGFIWDFEGDGVPDSNSENPIHVYEQPGPQTGEDSYLYYPVLTVVDNRGVEVSTADDLDGDGQSDWRVAINAVPPSTLLAYAAANPGSGQAPLPVVFSGGASGGEPPYEFYWDFGDGAYRDFDSAVVAQHTYTAPGNYNALLTVRDNQGVTGTSGIVPVYVSQEATFSVSIEADATEGPVPFKVQLTSYVEGGKEPIHYNWEVFTDLVPTGDEPIIVLPPTYPTPIKDPQAIVVPDRTTDPNPVITFATFVGQYVDLNGSEAYDSGEGVGAPYVVRLVAKDDNGVEAVSNLLRIEPRQPEPATLYRAERTPTLGWSIYGGVSAGGVFSPRLESFTKRANPAIASHASGLVYLFGGDIYNDYGEFTGVVDRTVSSYALNLSGEDRDPSGLFGSEAGGDSQAEPYEDGGFTLLNSQQGLAYAYIPYGTGLTATVKTPPTLATMFNPGGPPDCGSAYMSSSRTLQKSVQFVERGSAAAVMVHEDWDVNPGGIGACPG